MNNQQKGTPANYLFNVDILVEDVHHAKALEQLLKALNTNGFKDYRIASGIQLGQLIEQMLVENNQRSEIPVTLPTPPKKQPELEQELPGFNSLHKFMKSNALIRLIVNKGLGITLNIPCRVINIDENEQLITIYHVDEKQVYTFRMTEIEDILD
ncbi:hypothetical protein A7K91_24065 [Paenibacillus oryzae]|uniref:Uncharacterized protein n=1 Tax=Paenibacillus oryzae TaxID=1844972 RepID=A0A1A5YL94_9BACL|nr:hypothetical protein [Paenibacillus oryzae]OBR66308.1 hypothetical protein A7K91_24065 [Paenibacillus oryzae]